MIARMLLIITKNFKEYRTAAGPMTISMEGGTSFGINNGIIIVKNRT